MTVLVVDRNWEALCSTAKAITRANAAVTVVLKPSEEEAAQFAMYHPVDLVFLRGELFSEALVQRIRRLQPMAECHILGAGQDLTSFLVPYAL